MCKPCPLPRLTAPSPTHFTPPPTPRAQVMGAPLAGSPVQASVLTGGGIRFRGLRPKVQSKRIQMICEQGGGRGMRAAG